MEIYLELANNERILVGEASHDAVQKTYISFLTWDSELSDFMTLIGKKPIGPTPARYKSMCKSLGAFGKSAALSLPKHALKAHLEECVESIQDALCDPENSDYLVTYLTIKRFLRSLSAASVDIPMLKGLIRGTTHETIASNLKSFLPHADGACHKTVYATNATVTGRLTVNSGPQILTAPASVRSCLRSSYKDGKVLQVDLISAEPKFALHLKGEEVPVDVYDFVAKNILKETIDRKQAKLVTLCALYGQSAKNLEKKLPENVNARSVIRETRNYFDYDRLKSRLSNDSITGKLRNAVGRPLSLSRDNEHLLISYYLQSSVAESSILMFSEFVEKFADHCKPLFVVHDALILDCKSDFANALLNKSEIKLTLGDWKFDASIKEIGHS